MEMVASRAVQGRPGRAIRARKDFGSFVSWTGVFIQNTVS